MKWKETMKNYFRGVLKVIGNDLIFSAVMISVVLISYAVYKYFLN